MCLLPYMLPQSKTPVLTPVSIMFISRFLYFVNILCFELSCERLFQFISVEIVTLHYAEIQKVKSCFEFENSISSSICNKFRFFEPRFTSSIIKSKEKHTNAKPLTGLILKSQVLTLNMDKTCFC